MSTMSFKKIEGNNNILGDHNQVNTTISFGEGVNLNETEKELLRLSENEDKQKEIIECLKAIKSEDANQSQKQNAINNLEILTKGIKQFVPELVAKFFAELTFAYMKERIGG